MIQRQGGSALLLPFVCLLFATSPAAISPPPPVHYVVLFPSAWWRFFRSFLPVFAPSFAWNGQWTRSIHFEAGRSLTIIATVPCPSNCDPSAWGKQRFGISGDKPRNLTPLSNKTRSVQAVQASASSFIVQGYPSSTRSLTRPLTLYIVPSHSRVARPRGDITTLTTLPVEGNFPPAPPTP